MVFASLLLFAMAAATFPNAIFSALGPVLVNDLGVSRIELGRLVSTFAGVAAIGSLLAGKAADRFGGRRSLVGIFAMASASTALMAVVPIYKFLLVAAVLAGIGNAFSNPATNRLIVTFLPEGERGTIMGVKQAGVQLKFFLGGLLLPFGVVTIGWKWTVLAAAGILFLGVIASLVFLPWHEVLRSEPSSVGQANKSGWVVGWLVLYGFLMGAGGGAIVGYLPLYAHERLGFSVTEAGLVAGLVGLVGVFSRIGWGRWAEGASHYGMPLGAIAVISAIAAILVDMATIAGAVVLWVGAFGIAVGVTAWNSIGMLAASKSGGESSAGHFSGLVVFGFFSGFTLGPIAFGSLVDELGHYRLAWAGVAALFTVAAVVAWSARWLSTRGT